MDALEKLMWIVLGMFATYRTIHDFTRRFPKDDGTVTYLDGPFKSYYFIRKIFTQPWVPEWFREGSTCFYCTSFIIGTFWALILTTVVPLGLGEFLILSFALSAPTVFWASKNSLLFQMGFGDY